jgi:predicted  nucleic acid-binding Zn-ribbon protein
VLTSVELSQEMEAVEQELSQLRARVDEDNSVFTALEQQMSALREDVARTQSEISKKEARLAEKRAELAERKRLEALANYQEDLRTYREATAEVIRAADDLVATLDAHDEETLRLRRRAREMRDVFGNDERVAEVEAALGGVLQELRDAWATVLGAMGWRVNGANGEDVVEVLAEESPDLAHERRVARIKEYFTRG